MKPRVFLDTNVFIYAFEFRESNSRKVLDLLNQGVIEGIISERVLIEVQKYLKAFHNKDLAGLFSLKVAEATKLFIDAISVI